MELYQVHYGTCTDASWHFPLINLNDELHEHLFAEESLHSLMCTPCLCFIICS